MAYRGDFVAYYADYSADDADFKSFVEKVVALLDVEFEVALRAGEVAAAVHYLLHCVPVVFQRFGEPRLFRRDEPGHSAAAEGAAERARLFCVEGVELYRVARFFALLFEAPRDLKAARDAVGSVKKSAARHGVEMRADYDAFQPRLSSAQHSVQVARRVARGLHAVFAHHRLRNVHSLEIFRAVTGARVRAVFVAPRAPYRFQYIVYLVH